MKKLFLLLLAGSQSVYAQVKIFAHNDYEKELPFYNAVRLKADFIEADVFPVNGILMVAHEKKEIRADRTLEGIYFKPIAGLMRKFPDSLKGTSLAIDIKEGGASTIEMIVKLVEKYRSCFDPAHHPGAVRIVISGDRGPVDSWNHYPEYIFFDGRPYENYPGHLLSRIALVSDSYSKYVHHSNPGDFSKLNSVIKKMQPLQKPLRFWAAPDHPEGWKMLTDKGVMILNTDKVEACRLFLNR